MATMLEIPVFDASGARIGSEQIDSDALGGRVRVDLLKQAIVAFELSQRQGTFATKSRGMVVGSTRKIYRQKGTGNARAGSVRTPVRRGGGHAFAKIPRDFDRKMPRRMRRLARNSAILAKIQSGGAMIIDALKFDAPKTKQFAGMLKAVGATRGCLVALKDRDTNVWRAGRNIPGVDIRALSDVNPYEVLRPRHVIFSRDAFAALKADPENLGEAKE